MTSDPAARARVLMLIDAGQHQEAFDLLAPLLTEQPDDADLWCLNAKSLIGLERYHEAMASAKQSSTLAPGSSEPHVLASVVLSRVGDEEGSARAAREAVRLAPDDPASWERVCLSGGALLEKLDRSGDRADLARIREVSEELLAAADRVVALAPTESSAYTARGFALACAHRPGPAQEAYARARALDPDGVAAGLVPSPSQAGPGGRGGLGRAQLVLMILLALVLTVAVAVNLSR